MEIWCLPLGQFSPPRTPGTYQLAALAQLGNRGATSTVGGCSPTLQLLSSTQTAPLALALGRHGPNGQGLAPPHQIASPHLWRSSLWAHHIPSGLPSRAG